jgi:prolyl 4-hydroxylase
MRRSQPRFAEPVIVDGFLSRERCSSLLQELQYAFWSPSTVVEPRARRAGHIAYHAMRVSESTYENWFTASITQELRGISRRLEKLIAGFEGRRERWQATRYRRGGKFDCHFDCGHWAKDPAGDREHTVVIFLNRPGSGGGTYFPLLDLEVPAVAGRLLLWSNLAADGSRNSDALHAGLPILRGSKTVLVTWVRQRKII